MLQLTGVTKRFSGTDFTLDNVSLNLGKGLHVLVGPNGAGKSTLLRTIAGIMQPNAGNLIFNGQDIYSNLYGYKLRLGFLPQAFGFYKHMTGMEFLRYMASLKGIPPRLGQERADYVADLLRLRQQCRKKVVAWSVGLRQRLGLAQALLNDPEILVLDEPFCSLDPEEYDETRQLLARLSRDKVILISSHIMNGLDMTRLLLIINGRLRFTGLSTIFIDEAQGQVWAVETEKKEWLRLQQQYPASAVVFEGDRCRCKIVSRIKPAIPGARETTPALEDAYLFWLQRFQQAGEERSLWS